MNRLTLILTILLASRLALAADAPAASQPASQPSTQVSLHARVEPGLYWNLVRTEQYGVGVPQNWSNLPPRTNMVMFLAKQGIKDETRQALEVGMSIERLSKPTIAIDEEAKRLIARYTSEKNVTVQGTPTTEHLKLADGHDSVIVSIEFLMNNRRSYMQKLLVLGTDNRWVVSAYIIGGEKSILPKGDSDMARKLRGHLETFTLDPAKLNQDPLTRAYLAPQQPPQPPAPPQAPATQPKAK